MRANHIPVVERLTHRIAKLRHQADINHVKSPSKGNPYWCCKVCGIHDPELSIRRGRHFGRCSIQGLDKEIAYYTGLLAQAKKEVEPPPSPAVLGSRTHSDGEPV